jgi:hypothetical protein
MCEHSAVESVNEELDKFAPPIYEKELFKAFDCDLVVTA